MPTASRPATCHPDKRAKSRDGLCEACWRRAHRRNQRRLPQALAAIDAARASVLASAHAVAERLGTFEELVAEAERELQLALPEAARALRLAVRVAAERGDGRPAEPLLRGLSVPGPHGTRRLLEATPKPAPAHARQPTQVVVGLHVAAGEVQVGRVVGTIAATRTEP